MEKQKRNRKSLSQKTRLKSSFRIILFSGLAIVMIFSILFIYNMIGTSKKSMAELGKHGSITVSTANTILNEFTTLSSNASTGATSITVAASSMNANGRFSGSLSVGELIMIIQMQGATMTTSSSTSSTWGAVSAYNNAGKFEFAEVADVPNATTITLVAPLKYSYTSSGKVQIVRVPRYTTFTINAGASVTTDAWNGSTGGIVAIEANNSTTINGTIDVSGKGFRGGTVQNNSTCCSRGANSSTYATATVTAAAEKGEGIGGNTSTYDGLGGRYGRGAPANGGGGGNSHNAAGGGGSNGDNGITWNGFGNPDTTTVSSWKTAWDLDGATTTFHKNISSGGGRGGYTYSSSNQNATSRGPTNFFWSGDYRANVGGLGGRPLNNSGGRIFLGGGGGSGDSNNGTGTSGANGGGIVYILSGGTATGTGAINANGADAATATGTLTDGDAAGGGGGGGTVVVFTQGASVNNLTINANGGAGGNQTITFNEAEGAGGGGGGGYISITNPGSITRNVNGGSNGTTNSPAMTEFLPNGATKGATGLFVPNPANPYSGTVSLPVSLKSFSGEAKDKVIMLNWITASEVNNDHFTIEKSADGYNFSETGRVQGNGNSTIDNAYYWTDESPIPGDNYYRLTQTDYDGIIKKFNPIRVNFYSRPDRLQINFIGPNPFESNLRVEYYAESSDVIEIRLINAKGIVLRNDRMIASRGVNSFIYGDIASLQRGIYFIQLVNGDEKTPAIKVIKQ
ncbi:MAG: T9SS type A sorting domain-containing protein [Bacteroidetes bacterium]|nr:T9SS type A sorting domain-containing protein [Bacteroidota bacterium]